MVERFARACGIVLGAVLAAGAAGAAEAPRTALSDLGSVQQAVVSAGLGAADERYHARPADGGPGGYVLASPRQGLEAVIGGDGIAVSSARGEVEMRLVRWGCAAQLVPAGPVRLAAERNRVEMRREGLTEWYVGGPLGIEQGFTVAAAAPGCERAGELRLDLEVAGTVEGGDEGRSLRFPEAGLRYRGLVAFDAGGRGLPARLAVEGQRVQIVTDVTGASWPVVVDPRFEDAELLASDGADGDRFGSAVAVSGTTLVIGAPFDDDNGPSSGSAYVFVEPPGGWVGTLGENAKLLGSDGAEADVFGLAVAVSGGTIVVGARGDDDNGSFSGSAYVFVEPAGGWTGTLTEDAKLLASDGAAAQLFGGSVAVSGGTIVVSAPSDDDNGTLSGSAYVFVEPAGGWTGTRTEDAKLLPSDGASGDGFGQSVAVSGGTIVAGARGDDDNGSFSGSAYVFVEPAGGWTGTLAEDAKLLPSDGAAGELFGESVAVSGGTIVVGAILDDANGAGSGSAYVFVEPAGGWTGALAEDAKLFASDGAGDDQFGQSVAISGGTVVVGAHNDDDNGSESGAAYVFVEPPGGWAGTLTESDKLLASDGAAVDRFGQSVSVSGLTIVVGAGGHDDKSAESGAAYVFVHEADLVLTKEGADLGPFLVGATFDYLLTVTNLGPGEAGDVTITDVLPPEVAFVDAVASQGAGCGEASGSVTCELGSLAVDGVATVTLTVTIVEEGTITNTARATSPELDPTPEDAAATASLTTASVLEVPTLGPWALLLLVLALAGAGLAALRG